MAHYIIGGVLVTVGMLHTAAGSQEGWRKPNLSVGIAYVAVGLLWIGKFA